MSRWELPPHRAVQPVEPPVRVRVHPGRIWPPARIGWATGVALWTRALGVKLSSPTAGELTELVLTETGDLLARLRFPITVEHHPREEVMLLPLSDLFEPATAADRERLLQLLEPYDRGWR